MLRSSLHDGYPHRLASAELMAMAMALALMLMLAGCGRVMFAWQGPDPVFAGFDLDPDGTLSREEWERAYGTSASDEAVLDFDRGDCNRDGRLTWEEYFSLRYKEEHCHTAPLQILSRQAGGTASAVADAVSIHNGKEVHLARVSLVRNRQKLVAGKFHEDYSERDMIPGTLFLYPLSCLPPEQIEIPEVSQDFRQISRLAHVEPGFHPAIRCKVGNHSPHTVTYLRLRLVFKTPEGEVATFHGKTLWIPPQDFREFWVLPADAQAVAGIDLLAVRLKAE